MSVRMVAVALVAFAMCVVPGGADARLLELTFDDADDGAGPHDGHADLDNMDTGGVSLVHTGLMAKLTGSARRSAIHEGRYGRAADLPDGRGAIEVIGWRDVPGERYAVHMWVHPRAVDGGNLLELVGRFAVGLRAGRLVVETVDAEGAWSAHPFPDAALTADGLFHHVVLGIDVRGAVPRFELYLDFEPAGRVEAPLLPVIGEPVVRLGSGFNGMIDELMISNTGIQEGSLFDYSPVYCPPGLVCLEEVLTTVPTDFSHRVPVRFKSIYDPDRCTPSRPCPLLFDISGGGACADDYQDLGSVTTFAEAGFLVVTVDLYCEGDGDTNEYPTETSQLIVVKDHMLTRSRLRELIEGPQYLATGCSHGAGTVTAWSLREADHPERTYARSASLDPHCGLHAGVQCPAIIERLEGQIVELLGAHDHEDPRAVDLHRTHTPVELVTAEVVSSRQLALSWGINLEGPKCTEDGQPACNEEGLWAMRYGARRLRDRWMMLEAKANPTGYFVEDHGADCRHCAPPGSRAFQCGLCLLVHGRQGMGTACPACLTYDHPEIEFGAAAEPCPIEASWYEDPVFPRTAEAEAPAGSP